ncbi:MAG TPA: glucose-6-phosphate isomerase, partial [Gordonia polyisoprenivorans]|nr:glucose-6-phosphate isomerase [Gordonia polyisoprenivorans]
MSDLDGNEHDITGTQSWQALSAHQDHVHSMHLREVFAADPDRGRELTVDVGDLHIDYSKHRVLRETLELLFSLAREAGL